MPLRQICLSLRSAETGLIGNEALAIHHLKELEKQESYRHRRLWHRILFLSKLSSFPVHSIKIDQSFVARIGSCRRSELIIKAIVSLADMMSYTTIAEGVENRMQEKFLSSVGCGIFQGFLYYRPPGKSSNSISCSQRRHNENDRLSAVIVISFNTWHYLVCAGTG